MIERGNDDDQLELLNEIDSACDRFEADWKLGKRPTAEAFLATCQVALRQDLLPYLREIEIDYRNRLQEPLSQSHQSTVIDAGKSTSVVNTPGGLRPATAFNDIELPSRFDRFELQQRIGSGATSTVFRAYDPQRDGDVAIKICHSFVFANRIAQQRFLRELDSTTRLKNRHIIRVLEYGQAEGRPFLVMEYLPGGTLADALERRGSTFEFRTTVRWVVQLAEALQHAHSAGVIHRDIKPSNILLFKEDTSPSDNPWSVKLVDFGLAQVGETHTQMTRTGEVLGTLGYLSPEVVSNGAHHADQRSDIYSLGVLFYELLTGQLPFRKPMPALLQQILLNQPLPPRWTNATIPHELELICLKCLEKAPGARFQSATELQHELERWLDGKTIETQPDSSLVYLRKVIQRNKARSLVAVTVGILVFLLAGSFIWFHWEQDRSRRALSAEIVDAFLKAEGTRLPEAAQKVLKSPAALSEVEHRLSLGNSPVNHEIRLRSLSSKRSPADTAKLVEYMLSAADADEFAFLLERYEDLAVADLAIHSISPSGSNLIEVEFRRALLKVASSQIVLKSEATDKSLASGLIDFGTEEKITPWVELCRARKDGICQKLRECLQSSASEADQLAATVALVAFHRNEPTALVTLIGQLEDKQLQVVCDAILKMPEESRSLAVSGIVTLASEQADRAAQYGQSTPPKLLEEDACLSQSLLLSALFRLQASEIGEVVAKWPVNDPRMGTYFLLNAAKRGIPSSQVVQRLTTETNLLALRMLILTLNGYAPDELRQDLKLRDWLQDAYVSHPDAGVHAAIRCELRRLGCADWVSQQDEKMKGALRPGYQWYVTKTGIAMAILPRNEASVCLAISMEEITLEEYKKFRPNQSMIKTFSGKEFIATEPEHPVNFVAPLDALRFCEWLTHEESQPPMENAMVFDESGAMVSVDVTKRGYRLPTLSEMQFASQAGAATARYFGAEQTPGVENFLRAGEQTTPALVGRKLPNAYGLADALGNLEEWTLDVQKNAINKKIAKHTTVFDIDTNAIGFLSTFGGAFSAAYAKCLPSEIGIMHPRQGQAHIGFRVICIAPDSPDRRDP